MDRFKKSLSDKKHRMGNYFKGHTKGSSRGTTPEPRPSTLTSANSSNNPMPISSNPGLVKESAADTAPIKVASALSPHQTIPAPGPSASVPSVVATQAPSASHDTTMNTTTAPAGKSVPNPTARPTAWVGLDILTGVLEGVGGVFEPLKSAVKAIAESVELYEVESRNREEYATLRTDLEARFRDLAEYFQVPTPSAMTGSIINLANGITKEIEIIRQMETGSTVGRYVGAKRDADNILDCYRRINTLMERLNQNANMSIWRTVDEQATENRLEKLCQSPAASYDSAESINRRNKCTEHTRTGVLADMKNWAYDGKEQVYWLNGMAGTGKTTIACSLSDELHADSKLAASFFCSRQIPSCRDVNLIIPTISYQLARFSRPFRHALSEILEQHPDVHTKKLPEQFNRLIIGPLQQAQRTMPKNLVVVIDGLDECSNQDGVEMMLGTLLSRISVLPIKFFVSSRPEPKIVDQMQNQDNEMEPLQLRLHDLERSTVRQDIATYVDTELRSLHLSTDDLQKLTNRCDVLFIFAATAARYIKSGGRARSSARIREVLDAPTLSVNDKNKTIDGLYTTILAAAFDSEALNIQDSEEMRTVLHSVVCAKEPLTPAVIAGLLKIQEEELVLAALAPLSSVLAISESSGVVTTLHASFPDYLFDKTRSGTFSCNAEEYNARLAQACFDLIKRIEPPFNICELESSFIFDKDIPGLDERVKNRISPELFYACRYWISHIQLRDWPEELIHALNDFLTTRFLLWMEVMNLKQCNDTGARGMLNLQSWAKVNKSRVRSRAEV